MELGHVLIVQVAVHTHNEYNPYHEDDTYKNGIH